MLLLSVDYPFLFARGALSAFFDIETALLLNHEHFQWSIKQPTPFPIASPLLQH